MAGQTGDREGTVAASGPLRTGLGPSVRGLTVTDVEDGDAALLSSPPRHPGQPKRSVSIIHTSRPGVCTAGFGRSRSRAQEYASALLDGCTVVRVSPVSLTVIVTSVLNEV
ncbi:hypothetical protein Lfu02_60110 [Longispora fulva]|nr:hypothetical protein Lfu02_60110 [Longispora fulva]